MLSWRKGRACRSWKASLTPSQNHRDFCSKNPNSIVPTAVNDILIAGIVKLNSRFWTAPSPELDKDGYYFGAWIKISPR